MREILFKAKRLDNWEWVCGDVGFNNKGDARIWLRSDIFTSGIPVDPKTICQYTGLKDRNGAMIFDGDNLIFTEKRDWIKFDSGNAVFVDSLGSCGCCFDEFNGSGFAIQSSCGFYYATCIDEYWELTGKNIHDK